MRGIVLLEENAGVRAEAKRRKLAVTAGAPAIAYAQTLVVGPGVAVPWDLVGAGFDYLERWDAAAPLWRYGVLAQDVGTAAEREQTRLYTLDLRVPLYEPGLLFLRQNEAAQSLLNVWRVEGAGRADGRLAFLRALCMVKPLFLALPRSWLTEAGAVQQSKRRVSGNVNLVHIEIAPGRSVCCRPDEVEEYKRRFAQLRATEGRRC